MSEEAFVTSSVDQDILVIKLHGRFDGETVPEFDQLVDRHFAEGHEKIIIDCAHLGFINSLAIGSLVRLQTRLKRKGGEVKLAALQGMAADVIRLVKLDRLLDIYGDTAFAKEAFAES